MRCGRGTIVGRNSWGAEGHFTTERSKEREVDLVSRDTKREYWPLHTHQSFVYVLTRTSTDQVGENIIGRSLGKTAGCDLRRTCGWLGDAGRHAGVGTALEQRLLLIGDCNTVRMETFLMCGDTILQV
ncbi:UNVERIFIED_CONTAM: hypothetical protein Slati_0145800 [Sesamum latifolium]|uniref:Uncharacterized protein n=1 Tax=Sesamum latifolium TaxID=2727402 RepID=A0AAW2Y9V8_9LAMI